ncbi:MAG: Ig-like domain-containing protein [Vicinamibacterales bacterium]
MRVVAEIVAGEGVVSGEVYDDTTGLPVPDAVIELRGNDVGGQAYSSTAVTNARGQYFLTAGGGEGVLSIEKSGWTRVDRHVSIVDQESTTVFDARLTPTGASSAVVADIGGTITSGDASITLLPGALPGDAAMRLLALSGQGLQGLLPAGWSPVGAVDLHPHGLALAGAQTISLANRGRVALGTPLVLASWDEAAHAWRAVQSSLVNGDGARLVGQIVATGQYAWRLADTQPAAPPAAVAGALLGGVSRLPASPSATAEVTPVPRVLFYRPGVNSTVTGVLNAGAAQPSGTFLRVGIEETYAFTSGTPLHLDPFVEDLVAYQWPGSAALPQARFVVTPSATFEPLLLQEGVIAVELRDPASSAGSSAVGIAGGLAVAGTGERLTIPPLALNQLTPIDVHGLDATEVGVALPSELAFLGAASVGFSGASLNGPAVLAVPRRAGVDDSGVILLLRVANANGTRFVLTGLGLLDGSRIVSSMLVPGVATALDGVRVPGRYVFAKVTVPVGFATGVVRGPGGAPFAGALVSTAGWPTFSLSGAGGAYVAVARVGAVSVQAVDQSTGNAGSASGLLPNVGGIVSLDISLGTLVPRVTSLTPTDGAANVALSSAVVATFSEPIAPASLNGAGGGSIIVTAPDGGIVPGSLGLSNGNTRATFRPSAILAPNTAYTVTLTTGFRNLNGQPLAAAVIAHFTSLDTAPPVAPPAGNVTASIPDADGFTTVTATQGTAGLHDTVSIVNLTQNTSFPALVDPNGSFTARFLVALGDKLQVALTDPNGNQTVVPLPPFTRTNPDGSKATVVSAEGGRITGPNGTIVDVPAGALPDGTIVTVSYISEAAFPVKLTPAQKEFYAFAGGVGLDFNGATPSSYLNVSIPAAGGETRDDRWMVGQVVALAGQTYFNIVDTARIIEGRIATSSPPCPGVQAAAAYGFVKSAKRSVGVLYGRFQTAAFYSGPQVLSFTQPGMVESPFSLISTPGSSDSCMPILSGRVTVTPNSQKLVIEANQFTPADREIVVRNLALSRSFHYPRNVAEYRFLVSGSEDDTYHVSVVSNGQPQTVTPEISAAQPGFVNIRLDMNALNVAVSEVVIRNTSKNPVIESHFPQSAAAVKIPVAGGAGDGYEVTLVTAAGLARVVPATVESPGGAGNLVAKAIPVTIDPGTDVFLERRDGRNPQTVLERLQIPEANREFGGFTFPFIGDADTNTFTVEVVYHDGRPPDAIGIPNVAFTQMDAVTGRVIKTFSALVPPPDEPFNLGSLSGDTSWPLLTGTPSFLNNFDPSSPISLTFSEGIDRESAMKNIVLLDAQRRAVAGEIRMSDENRVVTFVPDVPLKMGAQYTLEFQALADGSGNYMGSTVLKITTFTPTQQGSTYNGGGNFKIARQMVLMRKTDAQGDTKTYGFTLLGGFAENRQIAIVDLTRPDQPTTLSTTFAGDVQRVFVMPDVRDLVLREANPCGGGATFSGDLMLTSSFTNVGSAVRFYDVTNRAAPCMMGAKLLTLNPSYAQGVQNGLVYTDLGFARTVLGLPNGARITSYTAIENVGIMLVDVGGHIPTVLPANRVREQMVPGNYTDMVEVSERLLAVERTAASLDILDRNLAQLSSTSLPLTEALTVAYADGVPVDGDKDGQIAQEEIRNLAFVGGAGGVAIVDVTDLGSPFIAGKVAMGGAVFEMDYDAAKRRLFAGGPVSLPGGEWAVRLIDLSGPDPFTSFDADHDGEDDRVVWQTPVGQYGLGTSNYRALHFDEVKRVLYVGSQTLPDGLGGFDTWALDNLCCDLGVDMNQKPKLLSRSGSEGLAQLLQREKKGLQIGIAGGLSQAAACGVPVAPAGQPVTSPGYVSIIEQGSGACVWKANAVQACGTTYQPGLSDHDYEVFVPKQYMIGGKDSAASCLVKALGQQFVNDDGTPKEFDVDGVPVKFPDITFYPVERERFDDGLLDASPAFGSGSDGSGDYGLGRQQLLLKWVLEGEYVDIPQYSIKGPPLEQILTRMRTTTGIQPLEGYEWGTLQNFALVKSRAFLRVKGAADPDNAFNHFYVAQLHDAGKAGIRAALARMVADPVAKQYTLNVSREEYGSGACRNIRSNVPPAQWNNKPCTSFEEFVASAAARSLAMASPIFTAELVSDTIHWFYRVKADVAIDDEPPVTSEEQADVFIRTTALFIENVLAETKEVYDSTIGSDPQAGQRGINLEQVKAATTKKLEGTSLHVVPRVFNHGFTAGTGLDVSMYVGTDGPGTKVKSLRVDLVGGQERFLKDGTNLTPDPEDGLTWEDRSLLDLTALEPEYLEPLFVLGNGDDGNPPVDLGTDFGQAHYVAFTIDLPEKKVREANRHNNYGGFWYYVLDRTDPSAVAPNVPAIPLPLTGTDLLVPDAECIPFSDLKITQTIVLPGLQVEVDGPVYLDPGQQVQIKLRVSNGAGKALTDVRACSSLIADGNNCKTIVSMLPDEEQSVVFDYTAPRDAQVIDAIATVTSADTGTRQSGVMQVLVGCETEVIVRPESDPNPDITDEEGDPTANPPVPPSDSSKVMRGGTGIRYYRVVDRRSGIPVVGVNATVSVSGPEGSTTMSATSDDAGYLRTSADTRGIRIQVPASLKLGDKLVVSLKLDNAVPYCQGEPQFALNVDDRAFTKTWAGGGFIQAEGAIEVGLSGKGSTGIALTLNDKAGKGHQSLGVGSMRAVQAGVYEDVFSTGGEIVIPGFKAEAGASARAGVAVQMALTQGFDFPIVAATQTLAPEPSKAFGGLLLKTLSDAAAIGADPITKALLYAVSEQLPSLVPYRVSDATSVSLEGSFKPKAGAGAGLSYSKENEDLGGIDYGMQASVGGVLTVGATIALELKPKTGELQPSFELKGSADIKGALTYGESDEPDPENLAKLKKRSDQLKAVIKAGIAGGIKGTLTLAPVTRARTKLTLALSGQKEFGWQVDDAASEKKWKSVANGPGPMTTITFTTTDAVIIDKIMNAMQTLGGLKPANPPDPHVLGLEAAIADLRAFMLDVTKSESITYEISETIGDAFSLPFIVEAKELGVGGKVGAGLTLDRAIGQTLETGLVRGGELFPLAVYEKDDLIPSLVPPDDDEIIEFVDFAVKGLFDLATSTFDTVKTPIVDASNAALRAIRSNHTAQITYDPQLETTLSPVVSSFTYTPVPAVPNRPPMMRPDSVRGPAEVPHYGIGGFHLFGPDEYTFSGPATMTFFYRPDEVVSVDQSRLAIYRWDPATLDWAYLGGVPNPAAGTVTVPVTGTGLYTLGVPMPAGNIVLTPVSTPAGTDLNPRTIVSYTSNALRMNTGAAVANGTMYTVLPLTNEATATPFGTITTPDEDPLTAGVQVSAQNGVLAFTVDYPAANSAVFMTVASREGTALASQYMALRP